MSFLDAQIKSNTGNLVTEGTDMVKDATNKCVQECVTEGQKAAAQVVDKGCQIAKEAGGKAVGQFKVGCKKN